MQLARGVGGLVLAMMLCLVGCGSARPSLTAAELAKKYPDKKYVQLDGVAIHYEQGGLGRPMILLHGLLTYSNLWRNIVPGLTYGTTIYNLDLMGFGFSEKPQTVPYSLDTYVTQLGKFLDDFHLENPILVGHDIGGVIATAYALRNPGKVRKLVLINAPLSSATWPWAVRLLRVPLLGDLFTGDWFLKRLLHGGVLNPAKMAEPVLKEYLKPYHDDPGARTALLKFLREFNPRSALQDEIQPNLTKLQVPTLLLWSDQNPYVPLDIARKLNKDMPQSDYKVVLRTGHFMEEERPEEVRAVIQEFIQK